MGSSQSNELKEQVLTLQIENEKLGKENDELRLSKSNCEICEPCNYYEYVTKKEYNNLNNKYTECQTSTSVLNDNYESLKEKSDQVDEKINELSNKYTTLTTEKTELENNYNEIVRKYNDLVQKYEDATSGSYKVSESFINGANKINILNIHTINTMVVIILILLFCYFLYLSFKNNSSNETQSSNNLAGHDI